MTDNKPLVEAVDWHGNGSSGDPFRIAIVNDPEDGRMLVIDFQSDTNEDEDHGTIAVVNLDQASAGNIFMFRPKSIPAPSIGRLGGNAWGGDRYASKYRDAIKAALSAQQEADQAAREAERAARSV